MRGDIDLMVGGPNFDRLYHKLKVLLMAAITQCNLLATMLLKLVDLYLIAFKFAQWCSINTKESGRWIASCKCSLIDPTLVISTVVALTFQ